MIGIVAFGIVAAGLVVATQYSAASLRYDRRLGPPLAVVAGAPVYAPWSWLCWSARYEHAAPRVFAVAQAITFGAALAAFGLLAIAAGAFRHAEASTAHGSARWATRRARMTLVARSAPEVRVTLLAPTDHAARARRCAAASASC